MDLQQIAATGMFSASMPTKVGNENPTSEVMRVYEGTDSKGLQQRREEDRARSDQVAHKCYAAQTAELFELFAQIGKMRVTFFAGILLF